MQVFNVKTRFKGTTIAKEVLWLRPQPGWTKVNCDGAAFGQPGMASSGGVFRMYRGFSRGSFALPLGVQTSIFAELMGLIVAVELADIEGWFPLWIETDSTYVVSKVLSNSQDVPWSMKVRWRKCQNI